MARGRMLSKIISLDEKVKRRSIPIPLRLKIIQRDEYTCRYCGKEGEFILRYGKPTVVENPEAIELSKMEYYNGPDVIPFQIDHILPIAASGQNIEPNLALSCRHCNLSKGMKTNGE